MSQKNLNLDLPDFIKKILPYWIGLFCLLISISFFLRTYDTAQVKMTLLHLGGIGLISLWISLIIERGSSIIFNKKNFFYIAPFVIYFLYQTFSFLTGFYKLAGFEEYIRYIIYTTIILVAISEFDKQDANTINKFIFASAWVCFGYGLVQIIDLHIFNQVDWLGRLDPFPWRGFFYKKIFSLQANPNFFGSFIVFTQFIILINVIRTKSKSLFVLFLLGLLNLYFTGSKGAWVSFTVSSVIFCFLYYLFFGKGKIFEKHKLKIFSGIFAFVLLSVFMIIFHSMKRMQSVDFRVFTWLSSFEMIQEKPITGYGIGSFKAIYPAYKRPQIFYMENIQNSESHHAENEHIEQWVENGIIGFGLYIWVFLFIVICAFRKLKEVSRFTKNKERAPPEYYHLLGFLIAFVSIFVHNSFDVSMRFVSTGVFCWLFAGLIINLSCKEFFDTQIPKITQKLKQNFVLKALKIVAVISVLVFVYYMFKSFIPLSGMNTFFKEKTSNQLLILIAFVVFCSVLFMCGYVYLKTIYLSRKKLVPIILSISLIVMYFFYGFFQANNYFSLTLHFVKKKNLDAVLLYSAKAVKKDFAVHHYKYFFTTMLLKRFKMAKTYEPRLLDKNDVRRNDPQRILDLFSQISKASPNFVTLHHSWGTYHYRMANYYNSMIDKYKSVDDKWKFKNLSVEHLTQAENNFKKYAKIDPVFFNTYYDLSQIYMIQGKHEEAVEILQEYIQGPTKDVVREDFLNRNRQNIKAHIVLARRYLELSDIENAGLTYKRILEFDPNNREALSFFNQNRRR